MLGQKTNGLDLPFPERQGRNSLQVLCTEYIMFFCETEVTAINYSQEVVGLYCELYDESLGTLCVSEQCV